MDQLESHREKIIRRSILKLFLDIYEYRFSLVYGVIVLLTILAQIMTPVEFLARASKQIISYNIMLTNQLTPKI